MEKIKAVQDQWYQDMDGGKEKLIEYFKATNDLLGKIYSSSTESTLDIKYSRIKKIMMRITLLIHCILVNYLLVVMNVVAAIKILSLSLILLLSNMHCLLYIFYPLCPLK
jgi:hypothetical protein